MTCQASFSLLFASLLAAGEPNFDEFDKLVDKHMKEGSFPSLSAGIVQGDKLLYARAKGVADRRSGQAAAPETLYRIGSVTKVFTATLLAILRDEGRLRLDDPVAAHLPGGVKLPTDPRGAPAITFRHLATHTSGLPRLPVNLVRRGEDFYAGFSRKEMLEGLVRTVLETPIGTRVKYSNLGYALLGAALERPGGKPYVELLSKKLLVPLAMGDTAFETPGKRLERLARGYGEKDTEKEVPEWDLGCLAPGGGLVSSAPDLAKFLSLHLRAGEPGGKIVAGGTLRETQTPQRLGEDWTQAIGLGWHIRHKRGEDDIVWHNGRVGGFASYVGIIPERGVGAIALTNCEKNIDALGVELLTLAAKHHGHKPPEDPAASIDPEVRRILEVLRKSITDDPPDKLKEQFHENFLAEVPVEKLRALLRDIHKAHGACTGVDIKKNDPPRGAKVVYRFAGGDTVNGDIQLSFETPARIVGLFFR